MFTGSIVALVTPMDNKGAVDYKSLKNLIDYHVFSGTTAIVAAGTTGESATLTGDEHMDIVVSMIELADGRIPVISSISANATSEAISLTKKIADIGVIGCLTVTPYYNKPTQEGLYQHFKAIAESTPLPHILYNVPSRTGCDLLPETIARLAQINNIVAIKEATGCLSRVSQIQQQVDDENFILLSGDDATALDFMKLGGKGVISVTANVAAHNMAKLCALAIQGKFAQAYRLNKHLIPLHKYLFVEANPIPVKWACKALELIETDTVRLPLTPLSAHLGSVVELALKRAGLLQS